MRPAEEWLTWLRVDRQEGKDAVSVEGVGLDQRTQNLCVQSVIKICLSLLTTTLLGVRYADCTSCIDVAGGVNVTRSVARKLHK
jgi:hypothetical protein